MEPNEVTERTFVTIGTQTEILNTTSLTRSDSFNMIVDPPSSSTTPVTAAGPSASSTTSSVTSVITLPFHRLTKSHNRCPVCLYYYSDTGSSALQFESYTRVRAFLEHNIVIVSGARCCVRHVDSGYFTTQALQLILHGEKRCDLSLEELLDIFTATKHEFLSKVSTVQDASNTPPLDFDGFTRLSSDNYYVLTGLKLEDFNNLCSRIPRTSLKDTSNRSARTAIACLLMKLRLGVSHQVLATLLLFKDKRTVSRVIHSARKALIEHFVPHFLGFEHITRRDVIDIHTRPLADLLLSDQPGRVILILDGTYIYFQKSANNVLQRRTFSLHKGKPLVKPMLITTTTGYIVACMGPYFADYKNNDAEITKHILCHNKENIAKWLRKGDILVIDRGFRDALDYLHLLGYQTHMPAFLSKGAKQFDTASANQTRFVTKIRWVIESANGRIKQWRLFDKVLPNSLLKTVGDLVAIVCALQNSYGAPFIQSMKKDKELAQKMLHLRDETNELGDLVAKLRDKAEKPLQWKELDASDTVPDFPHLTFKQLNDLTLGTYQLKQAKSYTVEHLAADGKYVVKVGKHRPDLIKAKIQSRHRNSVSYDVWIRYSSQEILGWYCTCPAGARVVGCCAHSASIIWYLSFARHHPEHLKQESSTFLNSLADAAEYSDISDDSGPDSDSDDENTLYSLA
ncbi:unnamed protein product [Didymodactylos carnosus]|uniref:SWIM-type domain-containing protein n=1 Tax=Didymodactylos carnosus TaxID=1234261 RepID=A0A815ZI34_9BILA|nr:unnamed protein product [Didymodactylos carnosus]CAF4454872.1 unnamed protein product [Didymodactylos carnosus]